MMDRFECIIRELEGIPFEVVTFLPAVTNIQYGEYYINNTSNQIMIYTGAYSGSYKYTSGSDAITITQTNSNTSMNELYNDFYNFHNHVTSQK